MYAYRSGSIQRVRKLLTDKRSRNKERAFVVEGAVALRDAVASGAALIAVVATPQRIKEANALGAADVLDVDDETMKRLSEFDAPPGIMGVAEFIDVPIEQLKGNRFIVCVGVSDPGNLGTIIRTAAAAGFDGLIATQESADVYNSKVVRASSAALFSIPVCVNNEFSEVVKHLKSIGCRVVGLDGRSDESLWNQDLSGDVAIVMGNEAHGLGTAAEKCDELVSIPMSGAVESLNVGVSAGIALFEVSRQQALAGEKS